VGADGEEKNWLIRWLNFKVCAIVEGFADRGEDGDESRKGSLKTYSR
jgi:hypothetical protein